MSGNLAFKNLSQKLYSNKTTIARVWTFRTALKNCWRSSLEYSGTKKEVVEGSRGTEDSRRIKISGVEIVSLQSGGNIERLSISSISLCLLEWSKGAIKALFLCERLWYIVKVIERWQKVGDRVEF